MHYFNQFQLPFNLQATKLFIVDIGYQGLVVTTPLELVFGSKYCIV